MNRYPQISEGGFEVPTITTLDLIDSLESTGAIMEHERLECRSKLRRAGYCFVPVSKEELRQHLENSPVQNGKVIEIAELKAIRESFLCARMGDWLQLPNEASWLNETILAHIRVLRDLWKDNADIASATVRSNWIADQIDIRGWAHRYGSENIAHILLNRRGECIVPLLTRPVSAQRDIVDAYWSWDRGEVLGTHQRTVP